MYLRTLRLQNFRNYPSETIHFSPGLNVLTGKNAQGKSSVIEALSLFSTSKSFRTNQMLDLVRKNTESFLIEGLIDTHSTKDFIRFLYHAKEKKSTFQHNLTQYASFSRILGILPGVFSVPSDIELLSSPNERRRFLNIDLAQKDPFYVHHLLRYNRAMKQRNALLRKMAFAAIDPWEREMAKSAAYITKKRQLFLENMEKPFIQYMQKLSAEDEVRYLFTPSIAVSEQIEQKYLHMLHKSRHKEAHVGYTLKGPHRDDFICQINGIDSKSFSQGQKCSIVLAMRLAQREELAKNVGHPIVFCIDDFGMGLDSARKKQLQKVLEESLNLGQIFITSPEKEPFLSDSAHFFSVSQGAVTRNELAKAKSS